MSENWETGKSLVATAVIGAVFMPIAIYVYNQYVAPAVGQTAIGISLPQEVVLGLTTGIVIQAIVRLTHIS